MQKRKQRTISGRPIRTVKREVRTAKERIIQLYEDIQRNGYSRMQPFCIGRVEQRMMIFAKLNKIQLASSTIYMTSESLSHAKRDYKKSIGIDVPIEDISSFPKSRRTMALYYDDDSNNRCLHPAFIYTDYRYKYIIKQSGDIKIDHNRSKQVYFVTATKVSSVSEFSKKNLHRID